MKASLVALLRCPRCGGAVSLDSQLVEEEAEIETGVLACTECASTYPVVRAVPRFVPTDNYARSFGLQWTRFRQTQLDSYTGTTISRDRLLHQTGWDEASLRGALVLDVGCGAGRFVEIALSLGAEVVAVDYSAAVDACWKNFRGHRRLHVIQADVFELPLREEEFDLVYCFGMLQHTPDPGEAFLRLPLLLKPGGCLTVDLYPRRWTQLLHPRTLLRPLTTRMPADILLRIVERAVPALLPLSRAVTRIPLFGQGLRHLLPVANYEGVYPLSEQHVREWAVLDTFDWLSPPHDHPQAAADFRRWFERAGLEEIEIRNAGLLVGRARRRQEAK